MITSAGNSSNESFQTGRRVALWSILANAALASGNLTAGLLAGSTATAATGAELAGDVLSSVVVLAGMSVAAKPADRDHPYGHGRFETLGGLFVGGVLSAGGVGICYRALLRANTTENPPESYVIWVLIATIVIRAAMSRIKFRIGRRIHSASLAADAWNDAVDILSAAVALVAVGLSLWQPDRFHWADHYGGFAVGLIVIFTGLQVIRGTILDLVDTMPAQELVDQIRTVALNVEGVEGVDKCYARKSGLQYFVDLHLEVDPDLTVRDSHEIAGAARRVLKQELSWVADVLVHIEPASAVSIRKRPTS